MKPLLPNMGPLGPTSCILLRVPTARRGGAALSAHSLRPLSAAVETDHNNTISSVLALGSNALMTNNTFKNT